MSLRYTAERVTKFASAVHKIAYFTVEYLRKFEDIFKKAFPRLSGAYGELFDEIKKTRGRKSRVRVPFKVTSFFYFLCAF
jgi:hypothetical protein